MTAPLLEVQRRDGIVTLTLDHPPLNALNDELHESLKVELERLRDDDELRVVLLRGAGSRAFSAGGDLEVMVRRSALSHNHHAHTRVRRAQDAIGSLEAPVIAVVEGPALGGGFELALACDLIVATERAVFGLPETNLGIFPGSGGTQRLARAVGPRVAKDLIFFGRRLRAEEAARLGLVSRVVPPAEIEQVVDELASQLAAKSRLALAFAKRAINRGLEMPLREALDYETDLVSLVFSGEDFKAGARAFLEERRERAQGAGVGRPAPRQSTRESKGGEN